MCISTVGRVVAIDGDDALVDIGGITRRAQALLVPDLVVGDEVLIGLGAVLGRVDAADRRTLELLRSGGSAASGALQESARGPSSRMPPITTRGEP